VPIAHIHTTVELSTRATEIPMMKNRIQSIRALSETAALPARNADHQPRERGKVVHDSRGTAIYDWDVTTGVLAVSKSVDLLQMLENPSLELEGSCPQGPEWSGDPYNRR